MTAEDKLQMCVVDWEKKILCLYFWFKLIADDLYLRISVCGFFGKKRPVY